eukprot:PhF_6_TR29131/c0_g1_i1/m.42532
MSHLFPTCTTSQELITAQSKQQQELLDLLDSLDSSATSVIPNNSTSILNFPREYLSLVPTQTQVTPEHTPQPTSLSNKPAKSLSPPPTVTTTPDVIVDPSITEKLTKLKASVREKEALHDHLVLKKKSLLAKFHEDIDRVMLEAKARAEEETQAQEKCTKQALQHTSQLIDVKENLVRELQLKKQELDDLATAQAQELKALEDTHQHALTHMKGHWSIEEKKKRESWKKEQTDKIREATLKSLEPDVSLLISKHKADLQKIEHEYSEQYQIRANKLADKERSLRQLKIKLSQEIENVVLREQELSQTQIATHTTRCEESKLEHMASLSRRERDYDDQMRKEWDSQRNLYHTECIEVEKLSEECNTAERTKEEALKKQWSEHEKRKEEKRKEKMLQIEKEHSARLQTEAERLRASAETEMRLLSLSLRKDTEEELRNVRATLESEHQKRLAEHAESKLKYEADLNRMLLEKEKYQSQIQQLEAATVERRTELKRLVDEKNSLCEFMTAQRENTKRNLALETQKLDGELTSIRNEWKRALQNEIRRREHQEVERAHNIEMRKRKNKDIITEIERSNTEALNKLHQRVQNTLRLKAEEVRKMEENVANAKAKALALEKSLKEHRALLD